MAEAACRGYPTSLFFAAKGTPEAERAVRICTGCPVVAECRMFIMVECPRYEDDYGIWGALTPEDRHRVRFEDRTRRQREARRRRKHNNQ